MPSEKAVLARRHLERAQKQLPEGDLTEAVMYLHLAGEAAVVAMAEVHGIDTKQSHPLKAQAARQLHSQGHFSADLHDTLELLHEAKKDTSYETADYDFGDLPLEAMHSEIETAVDEAEAAT